MAEEATKLPNHRTTIDGYLKSLPKGLRVPLITHNRNLLEFRNRSKLLYQAAGTRVKGQKSTFGQSVGVNFVHGTEMSSWGDSTAINNFIASLAESNPLRLYIFESTAKGVNNDFESRWQDAKNSVSRGTIFIGWWRMESYSIGPKDPDVNRRLIWEVYGQDPPAGDEVTWIQEVKALYDYDITREQLAWWRWKLEEEMGGDAQAMFQYYPPTEDLAFQLEGYKFFDLEKLKQVSREAKEYEPTYYRYQFGPTFDQTNLIPASKHFAHLKVWEEADPAGYYVIAADPAYGSSSNADRYAVQVFRCFTNKLVQVAEYCTTEGNSYTFAWVIAHLCAYYKNKNTPSIMVLEINGPGKAVMDEFFRLQQYPQFTAPRSTNELHNVVGCIQNYLFSRSDVLGGGNYNYHWKTDQNLKQYIMNLYRDTFDAGKLVIRSWGDNSLIHEMQHIQQTDGSIESGTRRVHDDLVMATALAIEGWYKMLLPDLYSMGVSYESSRILNPSDKNGVLQYQLSNYLQGFRREGLQ